MRREARKGERARCALLLHSDWRSSPVDGIDSSGAHSSRIGEAVEMGSAEERIRALGGIATTGELIEAGYNPQYLRVLAEFGRIVRIRKGWYASTEVDQAVIQARRVGGTLACMSALAHHGWCEPEPSVLHVSVPRSASRLRSPEGPRDMREPAGSMQVVVHWSRRAPTGDRQAVSLGEAIAQAHSCTRGRDTL